MNSSISLPVVKISGDSVRSGPDRLAIEEPLEIRLAHGADHKVQNLAVTMRTPGNDADLALGFLFTEGIITGQGDVASIGHVFAPCSEDRQNSILVTLKQGVIPNLQQAERNFYTTSSCGVCGKASIDAIRTVSAVTVLPWVGEPLDPNFILGLPDRLAQQQPVFAETGGLHAAAFFDRQGQLLLLREDVGRHNAVDKLIGAALTTARLPLSRTAQLPPTAQRSPTVLLLSGRASFELVQKAAMAGIPVIAAVGAPSSLAVSLAEEFGITLIGFLRDNRFNIYSATHRVKMPAPVLKTVL
jgi:FdhD protein